MKTLYDELYAKSPDIMGRPVHVANPDPLHNSTKINDNGTYDVSSFAEVKVDVGCGGGSDIACLKLKFESQNQTFSLMDISRFLSDGDLYVLNEYGALSDFVYTTDLYNVPSGTELRLLQMADHDGESIIRYYSIGGESQPEGIKDMVNLEWGQPEGFYSLVPVDPTKPSSATWDVDLDINGGGGDVEH